MKKSVKYITLVISSLMVFVNLLIAILLLADIKTLNTPATLILPELFLLFLIATFVTLAIWGFKFSNEKNHKTTLIVMVVLLSVSILFAVLAKAINPHIHQNSTTATIADEPTKECFNITHEEFIQAYKPLVNGDLLHVLTFDLDDEPNQKMSTYTLTLEDDSAISYSIQYNSLNNKINYINMFSESQSRTDENNNTKLSNVNLSTQAVIALTAMSLKENNIPLDEIRESIPFFYNGIWNSENEEYYAEMYEDEIIRIFVSGTEYINVTFTLPEKD